MNPPASWFAAAEPVAQMTAGVRRHLQRPDFKAAVMAWCELALYLTNAEMELDPPGADTRENGPYAEFIREAAAAGRSVAAALDIQTPAFRQGLFRATAYRREENFRAHVELAGLSERCLEPLPPEVEEKMEKIFGFEPPPPEPGEEWKQTK